MSEEIDIAELLKRVKEGEEPRKIEVNGNEYCFEENVAYADYRREDTHTYSHIYLSNEFDIRDLSKLKIKILDKPIIEELDDYNNVDIFDLARKVNEIIRYLNKENKE